MPKGVRLSRGLDTTMQVMHRLLKYAKAVGVFVLLVHPRRSRSIRRRIPKTHDRLRDTLVERSCVRVVAEPTEIFGVVHGRRPALFPWIADGHRDRYLVYDVFWWLPASR